MSYLHEKMTSVSLQPNYDFSRKEHGSFKGNPLELPPAHFKGTPVKIWKYFRTDEMKNCKDSALKTVAWTLARLRCTEKHSFQWFLLGGGFQELSSEKDLDLLTVGYLPPIPDTPTDMRVIYAAIRRTQDMMKKLETDFIFIEVDQAIYTKVIDDIFKMESEGKKIFKVVIPRMEGFHIVLCMLRTIDSLFKNCDLTQLLPSAGLVGMGTIEKYLSGGDVKEGIILHKKLFEALMRTKIEYIEKIRISDHGLL